MTLDRWVCAEDLHEGDQVDLEPILEAFPLEDSMQQQVWMESATCEYIIVSSVQEGGDDLVWVGLEGFGLIKLPTKFLVFSAGMAA